MTDVDISPIAVKRFVAEMYCDNPLKLQIRRRFVESLSAERDAAIVFLHRANTTINNLRNQQKNNADQVYHFDAVNKKRTSENAGLNRTVVALEAALQRSNTRCDQIDAEWADRLQKAYAETRESQAETATAYERGLRDAADQCVSYADGLVPSNAQYWMRTTLPDAIRALATIQEGDV